MLYGSVEYFESEILSYLEKNQIRALTREDYISIINSGLEYEILYDFVGDEKHRVECLQNLSNACEKLVVR
ncbi:hypothetical protein [Bacillus sp. CECT 9360]|uniref:hypothetical protein n=1 Tax=Bacillus sp. CECT 9360 TaxID=2845821 RepID=UPI001E2DD8AB|nr:hypothetical protein [Bacillus sp. CECT 9360]CAH0344818.1 hypothetical protein BCI9360_01086 [Bacillus sp. CECT 9360]